MRRVKRSPSVALSAASAIIIGADANGLTSASSTIDSSFFFLLVTRLGRERRRRRRATPADTLSRCARSPPPAADDDGRWLAGSPLPRLAPPRGVRPPPPVLGVPPSFRLPRAELGALPPARAESVPPPRLLLAANGLAPLRRRRRLRSCLPQLGHALLCLLVPAAGAGGRHRLRDGDGDGGGGGVGGGRSRLTPALCIVLVALRCTFCGGRLRTLERPTLRLALLPGVVVASSSRCHVKHRFACPRRPSNFLPSPSSEPTLDGALKESLKDLSVWRRMLDAALPRLPFIEGLLIALLATLRPLAFRPALIRSSSALRMKSFSTSSPRWIDSTMGLNEAL